MFPLFKSGGRDCPTLPGVTPPVTAWRRNQLQLAEQIRRVLLQILCNPFIFGFIMHVAGRWDEGGRWQWRGLGSRELLKIYLSNYALLRASIEISFNSLSTQQLRNMWGTGDAGLGF